MIQTKKQSAFTLIEVMVATVIMVILVGMVITITGRVLDVWSKSSGKLSANAEARIAMELITQDLETAVFRNNGQQWLRVAGRDITDNEANYQAQTVALKLFTPSLTRDKFEADGTTPIAGDVCGVAYRLEYKEAYANASYEVYGLYRSIERPDVTFNALLGSRSQGTASPQLELDGQKTDPSSGDTSSTWREDDIVSPGNYLASNIVDFKVLIYEDDGSTPPESVNWDETTNSLREGIYAYGGDVSTGTRLGTVNSRLLYADVILKVVSDEGLELLSLQAEGRAGTGYSNSEDIIREHGQTFTRRVYFPASPL